MLVAGVDEVGRGPLIGSVVAAAVILGREHGIDGLTDSKKLSEKRRMQLDEQIRANARCWSIAECSAAEIDEYNILQATFVAMKRAIAGLDLEPTQVLVDGNRCPEKDPPYVCEAIVKGDLTVAEISAASIIAKVYRDKQMLALDAQHPEYGFAAHKGYPTKRHLEALSRYGVLDGHRRSFSPVRKALALSIETA